MSLRPVPTEVVTKFVPDEPAVKRGTFSALGHSAFRLYFIGQLVSVSGTWMQTVAQQIVVYNLTNSKTALGLVACAQGLPALFLTPIAGVAVERMARRRIIVATQTLMMVLAFTMALLNFGEALQIWHIIVLSLGLGIANAFDAPARLSFIIEMVGHDDLPSAISINSLMFNLARIIGPALGGLALLAVGPTACFFLNGLSFLAVLISLITMTIRPIERKIKQSAGVLRPMIEGFRFARSHPTIAPLLILSALSSSFGLTFTVLFPPFADEVLKNKEAGTSALFTAMGVGALIASIYVARTTNRGFRGKILTLGAVIGPIAVIGLALSSSYFSVLPVTALAGLAFICQFVLTNTLLQTEVPDEFRGRVLSLYTLTFFGLTPFGSLVIGLTADQLGSTTAMLIFGIVCLIGTGLILSRAPQLRRLA